MLLELVNDSLDQEYSDHLPTKAEPGVATPVVLTGAHQATTPLSIPIPQPSAPLDFNFALLPLSPRALEFLRPLLHHKLRSLTNVNGQPGRGRLNSNTNLSDALTSIRQHRDSFLQHNPLIDTNLKYFGVPLLEAIEVALAKISIFNDGQDDAQNYGRIPIVVAKCGVYLKKKGLTVEGIFRVGGSLKRLKELQQIFNSPPDYGKRLNWDGYNVHDAALILRRYLNALPEPLIPLDMYEVFRDPLRQRPRIINYMKFRAENPNKSLRYETDGEDVSPLTEANIVRHNQGDEKEVAPEQSSKPAAPRKSKNYRKLTRDVHCAIEEYKQLVLQLPQLSKQLLFYILDLLAMIQNHSDENLMSLRNLAAIFQPLILLHPDHDMDPVEYALSQVVVEFLIHYAYKLLPSNQIQPPRITPLPSGATIPTIASAVPTSHSGQLSAPNLSVVALAVPLVSMAPLLAALVEAPLTKPVAAESSAVQLLLKAGGEKVDKSVNPELNPESGLSLTDDTVAIVETGVEKLPLKIDTNLQTTQEPMIVVSPARETTNEQ